MPPEDYEAIEAAVMDTARGRWFLAEFARRNRSADTSLLLAAIERLETMMAKQPPATAPTTPHQPVANGGQATSAKSELFAVDPPPLRGLLPLSSVPDDVAWATADETEEIPDTSNDVVEIDDQAPIWPTQAAAPPPAAPPAPAAIPAPASQGAMLAAALAQAEQMASAEPEPESSSGGVSPPVADPADLDALSFEEKSVYFA